MSLRIRMYDVGFGDCFLLSFDKKVHVLVDCGTFVTQGRERVNAALENIKKETGGDLAVVVISHLHSDHHCGFTENKELWDDPEQFRVGEVWLPWTENPKDPAALQVQETIGLSVFGIRKSDADWIRYRTGFGGAKRRYLPDGKRLKIPGVNARVDCFGPPKDPAFFRRESAAERLLRAAGSVGTHATSKEPLFAEIHCVKGKKPGKPPLDDVVVTEEDVLGVAGKLMNNRSLILVIRYGEHGILLPGDTEQGSWIGAFDTTDIERHLGDVTVLKVGHHGSWNATPRMLVSGLREGVTSLLSTQEGISGGNPVKEVLEALGGVGKVIRSDEGGGRDAGGWRDWGVG